MKKIFISFLWILTICLICVCGQTRNRIAKAIPNNNSTKNCRVFLNARILNNPKPIYPVEAKTSGLAGKVEVAVEIDETGNVIGIESTNGNDLLAKAASEAAMKAKFSPTTCDGKATKTVGIITYNFAPVELIRTFYSPLKIEDFSDINSEQNSYEAILFLTENYKIAFGYADQKFHPEMPLTKGDFAHFLRQILEMLDSRAEFAKKFPEDIGLYHQYNPHNLKEIEFNPTAPYAQSLKILSNKYKIILADEKGSFDGEELPTRTEVTKIWWEIFGDEAIPVNFSASQQNTQEISRGDFAIYLKESLDVLTYKLLP